MRLKLVVVLAILLLAPLSQGQTIFSAKEDEQFEARRQNFKSGREMLFDRGVTFEPEELLHDHWSKALKDALDAMPEMHQSRYETAPLKGTYFADTLYLPEHVQLDGHTVIVANYLVFEGKNPIIKGPFDLNVFPTKPIGILGMSLAEALSKKSLLVNVGSTGKRLLPSFSLIQDLDQRKSHITFDTSGPRTHAIRPPDKRRLNLQPASWTELRPAFLQNQNTSGS